MKIAIVGAGRVGTALGAGFARVGHDVVYGVRRAEERQGEDARIHVRATFASVRGAVEQADLVMLATSWAAAEQAVADMGDLGGRPLVDLTNPLGPGMALTHSGDDSGGEQVQRWAPTARVVKMFNTTGVETMASPVFGEHKALMLACGDDGPAVETALILARQIGFEAQTVGPLRNARLLEAMGRLWIELAMVRGLGRNVAFGLLRR